LEKQYANPENFTIEADDPVATKKDELIITIAWSREFYPEV
jgi:hypothetical protein